MTKSETPKKEYKFTIPCKRYIRKYIEAVYGKPFRADCYSSFGQFVILCLEKKVYNANRVPAQGSSKFYSDKLTICLSIHNYINVGSDISPENILALNNFIEELFSEHLYLWCHINTQKDGRYKGYADCIRAFAKLHNIDLDSDNEDISFDGLKRSELRYRNGKDGISLIGLIRKEQRQRKSVDQRKTQENLPK